jgi:cell division protein FtsI/penicillin-binding protein 2
VRAAVGTNGTAVETLGWYNRAVLRRRAVGVLFGASLRGPAASPNEGASAGNLDALLGSPKAAAVLVDISSRRLIAIGGLTLARRLLRPPGSTLKPFVLAALIESGRLKPTELFRCLGRLRIRDRSFDCVHPVLTAPLSADMALAYSCNCFVAHAAERFQPGEVARELERFGLGSDTGLFGGNEAAGRIRPAMNPDAQRIQALGEESVEVTVAGLALAYRLLALKINQPGMQAIKDGMEGAVEFGTAQNAALSGVRVAGKTGSAITSAGEPVAWFAGFLPSSAPQVALAVMLPGRSGGTDAAPVARRIFEAYRSGRL